MAVQAEPSWESLPPKTREVFEWAKACERTSKDVGTRALLIGILKAGGGTSPPDRLLLHFRINRDQLYGALQSRPEYLIDPDVLHRSALAELPSLTANAQRCLSEAGAVRARAKRLSLDPDCLFGAILQTRGTARAGLEQVMYGLVSIDDIADHYLAWLTSGRPGSYPAALAKRFPRSRRASNARADPGLTPAGSPNLVTLLYHRAQDAQVPRVAALGILVQDDLILTSVSSRADEARSRAGITHELAWISSSSILTGAWIHPPAVSEPIVTRKPHPGEAFRLFAVSSTGADVIECAAQLPPEGLDLRGYTFDLVGTGEVPTGFSPVGSPVLGGDDAVVGIVNAYVSGKISVIQTFPIDHFKEWLASGEVHTYADALAQDERRSRRVSIGTSSGAGSDRVAETDQLGFQVYVKAFADLIRSEHTEPPLTIGIFGSWGMGKSFLLEHITQEIDRQQQADDSGPRIHTVRFNAWEYLASDAIWPALVRKIVTELDRLSSWPRHKRVFTRLWWNLRRESRSLRTRLVTAGLVLAFTVAFAVGKHGLALGLGGLTALLGLGSLIKAANDPVGKWVTGLFAGSDYGGQIDVMAEIKHDLEELERRLHVDGDRIDRVLVVIDDLDRCEPAKAVEVLQAVNQLLSFPSFIVCLGIDARIITAAVEKHYEGLLGVAGASGYEYLDKIVQIPFRIPEPGAEEITEFLRTQLGVPVDPTPPAEVAGTVADAGSGEIVPLAEPVVEAARRFDHDSEQLAAGTPAADRLADSQPAPLALPEVLFTADELSAFQLFVPYLRPNPRHLKRLINVYRLVRSLGLAEGERLVLDRPAAVLRWLVMWAQWPLTSSMLLRRLDGASDEADPMLSLLDRVEQVIDRKARADRDDDPGKLRGLLQVPGCVLSVDEIRRIRRYTVNFNPAIEEQLRGSDGGRSELPEPA